MVIRTEASIGRPFAWAGLLVIVMLLAQVFAAGVSGAVGHTWTDSQQPASGLNRICWLLEAGVDAQCVDEP
jgi:hypothetical protein